MTAKEIQHVLFAQFGNSSALMVPNYTPERWFECDLFRITKAGFAEEYEIKLSVSDFKADARKGPDDHERARMAHYPEGHWCLNGWDPRTKHQRLAEGDTKGPRRFWFVMPEEIAAKVEIPEWAGLITVREWRGRLMLNPIHIEAVGRFRKARMLHRWKASEAVAGNAMRVFYHRYWSIRRGLPEVEQSLLSAP